MRKLRQIRTEEANAALARLPCLPPLLIDLPDFKLLPFSLRRCLQNCPLISSRGVKGASEAVEEVWNDAVWFIVIHHSPGTMTSCLAYFLHIF